jgi:hypothetical protein
MRTTARVALAFIVLACLGCPAIATTEPATPVQCPAGQRVVGTACGWNPVTITIGPDVQTFSFIPLEGGQAQQRSLPGCFVFSPNPQSVHLNQPVYWTNNSTVAVTVFQTNTGTPLATVAPGQNAGGVFWSSAGVVAFTVGSCASVDAKNGQIIVTLS